MVSYQEKNRQRREQEQKLKEMANKSIKAENEAKLNKEDKEMTKPRGRPKKGADE